MEFEVCEKNTFAIRSNLLALQVQTINYQNLPVISCILAKNIYILKLKLYISDNDI